MLLRSTLFAMFALPAVPALISSSQFPVVPRRRNVHGFKKLARAVSGDAQTPRTPGNLRVVENSGVCGGVILFGSAMHPVVFTFLAETTPGVYQASGYGDLSADKSIWFVLHLEFSLCFYL